VRIISRRQSNYKDCRIFLLTLIFYRPNATLKLMKRRTVVIMVTLVFSAICLSQITRAQATTFDTYTLSYSSYRDAHDAYDKARSAYLQFKTLRSKTDAEVATKTMLILRSQTFIAYLRVLEERIGQSTPTNQKVLQNLKLDLNWQSDHLESLKTANNLDQLLLAARNFQDHYKDVTHNYLPLTSNMVNFSIMNGQKGSLEEALKKFALAIPELPGDQPKEKLNKDLLDANSAYQKSLIELDKAAQVATQSNTRNPESISTQIMELQQAAKSYLLKTADFLIEIAREVPIE